MEAYKTVDQTFRGLLEEAIAQQRYVSLHYFTDIREFMKTRTVLARILEKDRVAYLQLATGENIRLDKVTRIDDDISPDYTDLYAFSCDC